MEVKIDGVLREDWPFTGLELKHKGFTLLRFFDGHEHGCEFAALPLSNVLGDFVGKHVEIIVREVPVESTTEEEKCGGL